jgi:hypothetical protein
VMLASMCCLIGISEPGRPQNVLYDQLYRFSNKIMKSS